MDSVTARHIRQFMQPSERLGASYVPGEGTYVRLWAPFVKEAKIEWEGSEPVALVSQENGYFFEHFPAVKPGDTYYFHCDGRRIADPASRFQPRGASGPSAVVAADYGWTDRDWRGVPFAEWVIYEIHTGAFSPRHDFRGIIEDLPRLKDLGVTTLEIMPVSQFSGARNWGYDGVFPHAVQDSYGGPEGLKKLVDECHRHGLAIILDVVCNHIGPEGNVLSGCGPYTQAKYHTPWGDALNFDGAGSDEVRRYFLQAAWQWLTEYHFDGLRLDAVQMIFDASPVPFLEELSHLKREAEKATGRPLVLIAESDMNDPRLLAPPENYGLGMDGQWADDLHHALHAALTGERNGYYGDYGGAEQIARIYRDGVAFTGNYSPFRRRRHGRSYKGIDRQRLIVETQNHDQTGNRMLGERLIALAGAEKAKFAAACVLLSPFTPLLFMGEEFGAENPFLYFISHDGRELVEAVRKGRAAEWESFGWQQGPPDPFAEETFARCVLRDRPDNEMQEYYRRLIALSKELRKSDLEVMHPEKSDLVVLRYGGETEVALLFGNEKAGYAPPQGWRCALCSAEPLAPFSATLYRR